MKSLTIKEIQEVIKEKIPEGLIEPAHDESGHHYRHVPTGTVFDSVTTQMSGVLDNPHLKVWAARLAVEHMGNQIWLDPTILKDETRMVQLKEASILVHKDTFEDAGGIGTIGHAAVEKYILEWMATGIRPTVIEKFISGEDSREWAILRSAISFMDDFYFLPVASELLVCSVKDGHAGTLDCLGFIIVPGKKCTSEDKKHDFWNASSKDWRKKVCHTCEYQATYRFALLDWKTSNAIQKKPTYCAQVSAYSSAFFQMTRLKTDLLVIVRFDKKQAKYEALKVSDPTSAYRAFRLMQKINQWIRSKIDHAEPAVKKEIISLID